MTSDAKNWKAEPNRADDFAWLARFASIVFDLHASTRKKGATACALGIKSRGSQTVGPLSAP